MKANSQNQMKLSQLRILVAVADQGNFSEAALTLEMSQSAVSHGVAALEDHLGIVLFSRGRQGARLTPVGERIVGQAREILARVDEIAKEAELARGLTGGQVRIASFRSVATHILPTVITQFHQRFPAISVSLAEHDDYPQVEQSLRDGRADIGFTFMPASPDLESWEVLRDEFVVLLPPSFQVEDLERPAQLSWNQLAAQPLIMPPVKYIMMQPVFRHARQHGCRLNVAYEVETDATIVNLVAQGLGATILPRLAAEPIPPNVQVYSLPTRLDRVIGVAVVAEALHPPAVYAFLEILKKRPLSPPALPLN
jgi:DNA-binding transcriptional LysR family regulator